MKATTTQEEKRRWVKQWDCPEHIVKGMRELIGTKLPKP